jgi:uncharacterized protein HemY
VALRTRANTVVREQPKRSHECERGSQECARHYNLGESYQDAGLHIEAHRIFSELYAADGAHDDNRFAIRLFASCQALGMHAEMRRIVEELDREPLVDFLKAQVFIAETRYPDALTALERVTEADLVRPGLFLQTAELYLRLRRWRDARHVYEKALAMDPDNVHAYIGLCRIALRRRNFNAAAHAALGALERVYHDPVAHFLLGLALNGMKEYHRAAEAFRVAISFNPNFPEAHVRLAVLLEKHLGDVETAREHRRLARHMRKSKMARRESPRVAEIVESECTRFTSTTAEMPPIEESLIVVTGLPRSGTSMLMQMLAAGGVAVLSDDLREADEDNPHGYLEIERVKNLFEDSKWLFETKGRAIKIVVPLLSALPPGLPCRVILCERELEEVLDSQERTLLRRSRPVPSPERRGILKNEYARALGRAKAMLTERPDTQLLSIEYSAAICDSRVTAETINRFLGGALDVAKMVAAIDPTPHRNHGPAARPGRARPSPPRFATIS